MGSVLVCLAATLAGQPDPALISTSFVERQNLTVRMCVAPVHSAHQRLQQEAENLKATLPLHFAWHDLPVADRAWDLAELLN